MKQIPNNRLNEIQAELEEYGYVLTDALLWHFEEVGENDTEIGIW